MPVVNKSSICLVATDANEATLGRSRPICHYPDWPRYDSGDVNAATSFSCQPPELILDVPGQQQ